MWGGFYVGSRVISEEVHGLPMIIMVVVLIHWSDIRDPNVDVC